MIWIIREPRSGSTWFTHHVVNTLRYNHCFLDRINTGLPPTNSNLEFDEANALKEIGKFSATDTVFSTHFFGVLNIMDKFEDPIIIRCTRRNTIEQFLSHCLAQSTRYAFNNIRTDSDLEEFDKLIQNEILIPKKDLIEYVKFKQKNESLWNECATKYKNFTVYYEDLCENGVDIPLLNMYNCKIGDDGHTKKMPDYKQKVFLNYDMVHRWMEELR